MKRSLQQGYTISWLKLSLEKVMIRFESLVCDSRPLILTGEQHSRNFFLHSAVVKKSPPFTFKTK